MPPVSILLLFAALFSPQPIADSRQPIVLLDISARTTYTDPKLVVRTSGLSPQTVYTPSSFRTALAEAIRKVYELGLFSQVVAETTMLADGVNLTFVVQEYPKLKAVEFEGYRRVKKKDLQAKVKLREGEVLSEKKVFEGQEALKKFYKEKGFLLVQINAVKSPPDSLHQVVLTYAIDEGDPVRIRSIEIYGNEHFTDPQIEIKLVNRQKTWYRKGRLKEEEFIKDLDRIVEFYKQRGFINARVLDYEMKNDRGWVDITITISEGKKYYFGNYAFQSEAAIDTLKLRQLVRYRPGKEYNIKLAQATLADLYTFYSEDGYIYAQVSPVEEINADTVNITYEINPGKPALVRLVQIEGNQQTRDNVIRREISSLPGYVFRRSEVLRSQRDIFNLGFFEDVSIDYRPVEAVADSGEGDSAFGAIDLIYKVKEKSFFGTIGAGVSYSAQDKFTGYIELQQPNLLGRGWRSALKLEKGAKKTNFELSFTEPWLFDTPTSAGFDASYLTRSYDYYDKQEIGGGLSFSRPLALDYTRLYLSLRLTDAYVPPTSISSGYKPSKLFNVYRDTIHKTAFAPSITLTRDSRDYIYNPISGSAMTYTLTTSLGDIRFHRHILDLTQHFPLFWKFGLKGRARFGYITGFSSKDTVPLYERFYPGGTGADGIRGYGERTVGPYEAGYPVGGRTLAIFSLEYKLRLTPQIAFLAFFDAGNTWNLPEQFNLSDLKRGAGVGVRLEIPMLGLIGFDFGYGFDKDRPGWEPHFQLGTAF